LTSIANPVRWSVCLLRRPCSECGETIPAGEPMARWTEIDGAFPYPPIRVPRHYCKPCGELLEDSLTTTEAD
jgi:hypothetical protein